MLIEADGRVQSPELETGDLRILEPRPGRRVLPKGYLDAPPCIDGTSDESLEGLTLVRQPVVHPRRSGGHALSITWCLIEVSGQQASSAARSRGKGAEHRSILPENVLT